MNCNCPEKVKKLRNIKKCYVCGEDICVFCEAHRCCPEKGYCHEKCIPTGDPPCVGTGPSNTKCYECGREFDVFQNYSVTIRYYPRYFCSILCAENSRRSPAVKTKNDGSG